MDETQSIWKKIWTQLKSLFRSVREPWIGSLQPMELKKAILAEVEREIVAVGGGRKIFPYNHVHVRVLAEKPKDQVVLEAAFGEGIDLEAEIRGLLAERGCSVTHLTVDGSLVEERTEGFGENRFLLELTREDPPPSERPSPESPRPVIELTVMQGGSEQTTHVFDQDRIHIGRLREVLDEHGRLRRRNDLAFSDEDEVDRSVSREHARIQWHGGEPRLIDERSAGGTQIFRAGQSIRVSSRDRRGIRLRDDDLLYFGRAAVRFRLLDGSPSELPESASVETATSP